MTYTSIGFSPIILFYLFSFTSMQVSHYIMRNIRRLNYELEKRFYNKKKNKQLNLKVHFAQVTFILEGYQSQESRIQDIQDDSKSACYTQKLKSFIYSQWKTIQGHLAKILQKFLKMGRNLQLNIKIMHKKLKLILHIYFQSLRSNS